MRLANLVASLPGQAFPSLAVIEEQFEGQGKQAEWKAWALLKMRHLLGSHECDGRAPHAATYGALAIRGSQ